MEISGDHRFAAPREAVYRALLDPKALQASMPGCEKFVEVAPQSYDLTIRVGIAAIKGTYSGNVQVREPVENDSYRLVVRGDRVRSHRQSGHRSACLHGCHAR